MRLARPFSQATRVLLRWSVGGWSLLALASPALAAEAGPEVAAAGIISSAGAETHGAAPLLLEVFVNDAPIGQVGEFREEAGRVYAEARELRDLGFAVPAAETGDIDLARLPGLRYKLDLSAQKIFFSASIDALALHRIGAPIGEVEMAQGGGTGFLVNYDAVASAGRFGASASALLEARATSGFLSAATRAIATVGPGGTGVRRLDSRVDYSDVRGLRRFSAGDIVSGALAWTRPVRMMGVQAATAFEMRPDLITYPLPTIQGKAAVASTVDVLVNGIRQLSEAVPAGPFYVPQLPITGGAGTVSVEIRDSLGRATRIDTSAYATDALLAPGLSSLSVEAGAIRTGFGSSGDDYGPFAAAFSYRRGLKGVTLQAHGEFAGDLVQIGVGTSLTLGRFAVATVAAAASRHDSRWGKSGYFAVERLSRSYRVGLSVHYTGARFSDLPSIAGDPAPRLYAQANGGISLGGLGALDFGYLRAEASRSKPMTAAPTIPSSRESYRLSTATMSYSKTFAGRFLLTANGFHDFAHQGSGVMASLSIGFGRRLQASSTASTGSGRTTAGVDIRQVGGAPGELDWEVYAGTDPKPRGFAQAEIRTGFGQFGGGIDYSNGTAIVRASASGALVWTRGAVYAAGPVRDSFAVVDTGGLAGVRVLQDNQLVGRTGRDGRLLLTDLRSFDGNRIQITADDLPMDVQVGSTETVLRPSQRAGLLARFTVKRERSVLLTLVDAKGGPIEVGASAQLGETGAAEPIGYDGRVFLQGVSEHNRLLVSLSNGTRCAVSFDAPASGGEIPELGPLVCTAA